MIRIKKYICLLCCVLLLLTACGRDDVYKNIPHPVVTITMEDGGVMRFELLLTSAPNTVANFISLVQSGFYDGLEFYRVVPGLLIQSGDPAGDGTGGADYSIKGEFAANGVSNPIKHERGVISMARKSDYDSASSQFFIMVQSCEEYNGRYAAFGRAMDNETLETIDRIASANIDSLYRPVRSYRIKSVTVETYGYEYIPVTIESEEEE